LNYPGFIGLGVMGAPMARNLIKAGHRLPVFDIVRERVIELAVDGAKACHSAREVAENCSQLFLMVRDQHEVESVLFSEHGAAGGLRAGSTVVVSSSIPAAAIRALAQRLGERGVQVMDAPVSGGSDGAKAATLAIMVGGEAEVFERVLPLLLCMGDNISLVGPAGSGQVAKAANQVIVALTRAGIGEALLLAREDGIQPDRLIEALIGGAADSPILRSYGARVAATNDPIEFASPVISKDMAAVQSRVQELGLQLPFTELVGRMYQQHGLQ
jgi:2-hydroxy-3-oxopropionate reductase